MRDRKAARAIVSNLGVLGVLVLRAPAHVWVQRLVFQVARVDEAEADLAMIRKPRNETLMTKFESGQLDVQCVCVCYYLVIKYK